MRVYYKCTLYEDIDGNEIPVEKARSIANKLDGIGIAVFEIVIPQQAQEPQYEQPQQPQQSQQEYS